MNIQDAVDAVLFAHAKNEPIPDWAYDLLLKNGRIVDIEL